MKRPTMLYRAMLAQASIDLDLAVDRDVEVIQRRYEHEGLAFLTLVLPLLSDALESGIESGLFSCPTNFAVHGRLPKFLRGFFKRVFDSDGSLLPDACAESIYWIRQITRFFKKPKLSCSPARERQAIIKYLETEDDLRHATTDVERVDNTLDSVANILWSRVFLDFEPQSVICGHGPGATAERLSKNQRRKIRQWPIRSEESYPVCDHAFHNFWEAAGYGYSAGVSDIDFLELQDEPAVRVVFVPKTQASPRVIAIEPSHMQFMQQGLSRYMMSRIESHDLTKHSVRFRDQTVNQSLARLASVTREYSTLDLSEASDRVHLHLVQRLFRNSPLLEYLEDARSLHANLPDGTNRILFKYASMGSALCFPVESCVFYTLILAAIFSHTGKHPTASRIRSLSRRIAVYGDDLIVPVEYAAVVSSYLESYALRVNSRKSFSNSLFRESCGGDYYNGVDVKPVYARTLIPEDRRGWNQETLESWVSTANQFYEAGKWHLAQFLRDLISADLGVSIPRSRNPGPGIYFTSYLYSTNLGYDPRFCCYKQKRFVFTPQKMKDNIDDLPEACLNLIFEIHRRQSHDGGPRTSSYRTDRGPLPSGIVPSGFADLGRNNALDPGGIQQSVLDSTYGDSQLCEVLSYCRADAQIVRCTSGRQLGVTGSAPLDFVKSTKRGAFKLKRQWITLVA